MSEATPGDWKVGDKAYWWNGPGHQSRAEVKIDDIDGLEAWIITPDHMGQRFATVPLSELERIPAVSEQVTPGDNTRDEERKALAEIAKHVIDVEVMYDDDDWHRFADAILAAGFRRVSPVTREVLEAVPIQEVADLWRDDLTEGWVRLRLTNRIHDAKMNVYRVKDIDRLVSVSPPAEVTQEAARSIFHDDEGYLREDVHSAIREAVRTMPPNIDAPGWIGSVQIINAALSVALAPVTPGEGEE